MTKRPGKPLKPSSTGPATSRLAALRPLLGLIAFAASIALISLISSCLLRNVVPLPLWSIFRRCVSVSALVTLIVFMRFVHRTPFRALGLVSWREGRVALAQGLALGFVAACLLGGIYFASDVLALSIHPDSLKVLRTVAVGLPAMVLVSVLEEMVFRGYLLRQFSLAWSPLVATLASSLIYALVHVKTTLEWPNSAFELVGLWLLGMVLALSAIKTRQLYLGIGLHASLAYFARVNKVVVEFTHPSLNWLVGTSRLVNGVAAWAVLLVVALWIVRLYAARRPSAWSSAP